MLVKVRDEVAFSIGVTADQAFFIRGIMVAPRGGRRGTSGRARKLRAPGTLNAGRGAQARRARRRVQRQRLADCCGLPSDLRVERSGHGSG